jgi:hypothetical protein
MQRSPSTWSQAHDNPEYVWSLVLFLQQCPTTDPMGPLEDDLHRSNNSSIVKNHVIST